MTASDGAIRVRVVRRVGSQQLVAGVAVAVGIAVLAFVAGRLTGRHS